MFIRYLVRERGERERVREREGERGIDFSGLRISRKYIDINTGHIIKSLQSLTIFS